MKSVDLPTGKNDLSCTYDLLGQMLSARNTISYGSDWTYDALGQVSAEALCLADQRFACEMGGRCTRMELSRVSHPLRLRRNRQIDPDQREYDYPDLDAR